MDHLPARELLTSRGTSVKMVQPTAKKTRFRLLTRSGNCGFPLGMRLSKAGKWLPASFQPSKAIAPRMRKSTLFAYTDSTGTESPNWPVVAR